MRSLGSLLAAFLMLSSMPVVAQDGSTKTVIGGTSIRLISAMSLNPDCSKMTDVTFRIIEGPIQGRVFVKSGEDFPAFPLNNPRSKCNTKPVSSSQLWYAAPEKYQGAEKIGVVRISGDGSTNELHYIVNVVPPSEAAPKEVTQANLDPEAPAKDVHDEGKIRKILDLTGFMESVTSGSEMAKEQIVLMLKSTYTARTNKNISDDDANYFSSIVQEELNNFGPTLLEFVVDFWKKTYTPSETEALYIFYSTPSGSSIARKQAKLVSQMVPELQQFMALQFAPKINARLKGDPRLKGL